MISNNSFKEKIEQLAQKYFDEIVEYRRHFHKHPELSKHEEKTSEFICSKLEEWSLESKKNIGGFGIYGFVTEKS